MPSTKHLGLHVHDDRSWIVLQPRHQIRPGHGQGPPTTSLPSHPLPNYQRNRLRDLLAPNRSQQHHGPVMDRARVVVSARRSNNLCQSANPNQREPRASLLYPTLRSQSYRPLHRTGHRKSSSPATSRSRTSWEIRSPRSRLGDKDLRHSRPRRHPILSLSPQFPKEGRGGENKNKLCLRLEPSRPNFVTTV